MRRSAFIQLQLILTILLVGAAITIRMIRAPEGAPMRDLFIMASPVFFGIAAKNGARLGRAAVVVGLIGLMFAGAALYASITGRIPAQ